MRLGVDLCEASQLHKEAVTRSRRPFGDYFWIFLDALAQKRQEQAQFSTPLAVPLVFSALCGLGLLRMLRA